MYYEVNGVKLHVQQQGVGDTALVFLHFYGGSARTWGKVIDVLKKGYTCIAYDHRGWGDSDRAAETYTIKDLADDAQALIQELGLKRYVLVGHSMGGKAAQLLASRRPAGLKGLVLVAPSPPTPQDMPQEMRASMVHFYDNREGAEIALSNIALLPLEENTREMVLEDMQKSAPLARAAWPEMAMLEDISAEIKNINVPTLVLAGESDPVDRLETLKGELLPRIPQAELHIIPQTGHLSPLEVPGEICKGISNFLAIGKL
ncbi:Pimeloyl-ACP methyl ester carboxylesterase [Cohnella sp. OV330]|uniref:alpha/beta fold hydrolase n=1 Tax=Cohnella sp. OV330 TaxID=1855288 RepID=UPI0008E603E4|nr:alpha/beta hydrolase [Cohnella sp. OV330]SFB06324.1 Pimeloyl-ACP methyl ester carboxylesterase [Cohnella sp. OV330]